MSTSSFRSNIMAMIPIKMKPVRKTYYSPITGSTGVMRDNLTLPSHQNQNMFVTTYNSFENTFISRFSKSYNEKKNPPWVNSCGLRKSRPWPKYSPLVRFPCPTWILMRDSIIISAMVSTFHYNFVIDSPANSPDRSVPATGVLNLSLIVPRNWNSSPSLAIA